MEIHGRCDERFGALREQFERNFTGGGDVGASFAATLEGEYVVDLWAGHLDAAGTSPWREDTIVCAFSLTKTMAALATLILVDREELRLDDRVTRYWPAYGRHGKEATEVRHFLAHTAGVPSFAEQLSHADLYDWDHVIGALERQSPRWPPGERCVYHGLTYGFLVGEIVRRVAGVSLGTFFAEHVAAPLGADFHIGLDAADFDRTGDMLLVAPMPERLAEELRRHQGAAPTMVPPATNTEDFRRAELPAVNGHGNARSVVRVQTVVANGGTAFGVKLLEPSTVEQIFSEEHVLEAMGARQGVGYALSGLFARQMPEGVRSSHWFGAGGSTVLLDHTNRACLSYVMNGMDLNMPRDRRASSLTRAFYEGLR